MEIKLTATEGSRNFSGLLNRIVYRGETAILTRNGRDIVRMTPANTAGLTGSDLAKRIRSRPMRLESDEADSLASDLSDMRTAGNRPNRDPWAE